LNALLCCGDQVVLACEQAYMAGDSRTPRGDVSKMGRSHMVQLVDKRFLKRANTVLLLTLVWGGVAACAIAATVYDVSHWFLG
jgi:hypothetical protein